MDESILRKLKAAVDAASYNWMTYDSRIIAWYMERMPWVALKLLAIVTHKVRSRSRYPNRRFNCRHRCWIHSLCATQAALSVKALWFLTHAAPKETNDGVEETLQTLRSLRASTDALSYTPSSAHGQSMFYHRYMLLWLEQHCPLDVVKSDHHCKYSSRLRENGDQTLNNVLKAMNSKTHTVLSTFQAGGRAAELAFGFNWNCIWWDPQDRVPYMTP